MVTLILKNNNIHYNIFDSTVFINNVQISILRKTVTMSLNEQNHGKVLKKHLSSSD